MIRRLPPKSVSDGGLILVFSPDHKEDLGIVAAVGPGKRYGCEDCGTEHIRPVAVKPGDKVLFSTNGHQITKPNGEEFVVLREPSIIAVLEDAEY